MTQAQREWLNAKNLGMLSRIIFWISACTVAISACVAVALLDMGLSLFLSFSGFIGLGVSGMLMTAAVDRGRQEEAED